MWRTWRNGSQRFFAQQLYTSQDFACTLIKWYANSTKRGAAPHNHIYLPMNVCCPELPRKLIRNSHPQTYECGFMRNGMRRGVFIPHSYSSIHSSLANRIAGNIFQQVPITTAGGKVANDSFLWVYIFSQDQIQSSHNTHLLCSCWNTSRTGTYRLVVCCLSMRFEWILGEWVDGLV